MNNQKIIIEANSPTNLIYICSYLEKDVAKNCILVWYGAKEKIDDFRLNFRSIKIPEEIIFFSSKKLSTGKFSLFEAFRYKKILKKVLNVNDQSFQLFTCFNSGIRHAILRDFLSCDEDDIFLYDDGLAGLFDFTQKYLYIKKFLYFLLNIKFEEHKKRLYADIRLKNAITISPNFIFRGANKELKIFNSSTHLKEKFQQIYRDDLKEKFEPNSALFCTHHSIETGAMSEEEYFKQIVNTLSEVRKEGANKIYYKCHHTEDFNLKRKRYNDLGMIEVKTNNLPAEIFLFSDEIKYLATPYNSVFFVSFFLDLLKEKFIISYDLKNHSLFEERKKLFFEISKNNKLNYKVVGLND